MIIAAKKKQKQQQTDIKKKKQKDYHTCGLVPHTLRSQQTDDLHPVCGFDGCLFFFFSYFVHSNCSYNKLTLQPVFKYKIFFFGFFFLLVDQVGGFLFIVFIRNSENLSKPEC